MKIIKEIKEKNHFMIKNNNKTKHRNHKHKRVKLKDHYLKNNQFQNHNKVKSKLVNKLVIINQKNHNNKKNL